MLDIILSWWGGGAVIAGALALAWFFPPFRSAAIAVAGALAAALYVKKRGADEERAKQEAINKQLVEKGEQARSDATTAARDKRVRDPRDLDNA